MIFSASPDAICIELRRKGGRKFGYGLEVCTPYVIIQLDCYGGQNSAKQKLLSSAILLREDFTTEED